MVGRKKGVDVEDLMWCPTIVSVDPGGTTGWSVISVHPESLVDPDVSILENVIHWSHGQIVGPEDSQASQVLGLIDSWPGCMVLIEDFVLRVSSGDRDLLSPVRITAKIEFGLYVADGNVPVHKQMPSEAKSVATDSRLKSWGFYERKGGLEHARDADRHGLVWLRKCKSKQWMLPNCWPYLYEPREDPPEQEDEELG